MSDKLDILYIEDDMETRSLMADILHLKNYRFHEAGTGLAGIRLAMKIIPNLIIIDLHLPDMEGYEVSTYIKSQPKLKDIPIIALTADIRKETKELTLAAGCDGFINKPINVNAFLFQIDEFLSGRRDKLSTQEEHHFLKKYNIQLVQKLSHKVVEQEQTNTNLSSINRELLESQEELTHYNDRLFYMNSLANLLRQQPDPQKLLSIIPEKIKTGFNVERCAIFSLQNGNLTPLYCVGIAPQKKGIKVSDRFNTLLKGKGGIIWFRNLEDVADKKCEKIASYFNASNFILANLNYLTGHDTSVRLLKDFPETEKETSDEDVFYIFIDKPSEPLVTYEARIFKTFLQTIAMILENKILYHQLFSTYISTQQKAVTDELTQLYNYRYLMVELQRETDRSQRFNTPYALIMFDIDFFKNYNDRNGHPAGDKLLKELAELVRNNTRKTDTAARYGGEEFMIVLPGLNKKDAFTIAQKIHRLIEQTSFAHQRKQPNGNLTVSMGLASFPEDGDNLEALIKKVDDALYHAKESGRNLIKRA